jgi:hypothetical protein
MKKGMQKMLSSPLFFICGALLIVPMAYADPVSLNDRMLDSVTAGTGSHSQEAGGSGGAIVGNSSSAVIDQTGGVIVEGEAQANAKALNLVNSSESTVANGVNVWKGTGSTAMPEAEPGFLVNQSNDVSQEQRRSASMPGYSRPEADTVVQTTATGSETHNNQLDQNQTLMDIVSNYREAKNTSSASVDTTIAAGITEAPSEIPKASFDTNVGKGLAVAGQIDTYLDGGEIQLGFAVGGAVSAFQDTDTSDSGFGGIQIGDEESDFSLYGRLILPELEVHINGAGCGVAMGSCDSSGTSEETTNDIRDNTVVDTMASTEVGDSEFANSYTEEYRSPFELNNAQAEYIVVDDSSLDVSTSFTLALSGSAQSGAQGMNIVNSTGSAVANGVNVAATEGVVGGNVLVLNQTNVISHSR